MRAKPLGPMKVRKWACVGSSTCLHRKNWRVVIWLKMKPALVSQLSSHRKYLMVT